MPGRHRNGRSRQRIASAVLTVGLVSAVSPLYLVSPAEAAGAIPSNFVVIPDTGGSDDAVGQGDLTQMGRDESDPSTYQLFWSWDDTDWPGGNTGDACALFDSNGDTNIDYAVCAEVGAGAGSTVVQSAGSPSSWTCDDSKDDRCAGPTSDPSGATAGTLDTFAASPPADLVTATDPFTAGGTDSTIQLHIPKASLPAGAALVNVCSFPSIGNGGNPDPKDCVVNPGGGYLVIHKFSANDNSTVFPFTVDPGSTTVDVIGNSDSTSQPLAVGTDYSISEQVPSGWVFSDAFCVLPNSRFTGTTTATGVSDIAIESGKTTTCYVDDEPQSSDLSLTKSASPSTYAAAGQTITYTLTATDSGNGSLFNVSISDPLLGGQLTDCTDGHGTPVSPPVDLDPGDVLQCTGTYQTTAADVTAGKVVNTATARGNGVEDESPVFHTASATVTYVVPSPPAGSPALTLSKTSVPASGSTVKPGDQVSYTLAYGNTGTAAAAGATLTDTLPAGLDYVTGSASDNGGYDAATRTLTWQLGPLAAGANGTVTFDATVASSATDGEVLHNIGVLAAAGLTDPSNSDDLTVTVPPVPTGSVTIHKSVDKATATFGDTLTYSITVGATGTKDQTHVVATDTVPDGTSYVAGSATCDAPCTAGESGGTVTWNVGTLAAGTSTVARFSVTVNTPDAAGSQGIPAERISNVAQVSFDADPVETSNTVTTDVAAVLGEKATRPPRVTPAPDRLPFTGLPVPLSLMQLLTMATLAITAGAALVRRTRVRPVGTAVAVVQWRDQ